jgi:hypothetical protein
MFAHRNIDDSLCFVSRCLVPMGTIYYFIQIEPWVTHWNRTSMDQCERCCALQPQTAPTTHVRRPIGEFAQADSLTDGDQDFDEILLVYPRAQLELPSL